MELYAQSHVRGGRIDRERRWNKSRKEPLLQTRRGNHIDIIRKSGEKGVRRNLWTDIEYLFLRESLARQRDPWRKACQLDMSEESNSHLLSIVLFSQLRM